MPEGFLRFIWIPSSHSEGHTLPSECKQGNIMISGSIWKTSSGSCLLVPHEQSSCFLRGQKGLFIPHPDSPKLSFCMRYHEFNCLANRLLPADSGWSSISIFLSSQAFGQGLSTLKATARDLWMGLPCFSKGKMQLWKCLVEIQVLVVAERVSSIHPILGFLVKMISVDPLQPHRARQTGRFQQVGNELYIIGLKSTRSLQLIPWRPMFTVHILWN